MSWTKKETENLQLKEGEVTALKAKRDTELKPLHNFINQVALHNKSTEELAGLLVTHVDRIMVILKPYVAVEDQATTETVNPDDIKSQSIGVKSNLTTGVQGSQAVKPKVA